MRTVSFTVVQPYQNSQVLPYYTLGTCYTVNNYTVPLLRLASAGDSFWALYNSQEILYFTAVLFSSLDVQHPSPTGKNYINSQSDGTLYLIASTGKFFSRLANILNKLTQIWLPLYCMYTKCVFYVLYRN